MVIDFHTHIYPSPPLPEMVQSMRHFVRRAAAPWSRVQHEMQTAMRRLPSLVRNLADEAAVLAIFPHLLVESSADDHAEAMRRNQVDYAVTVAFPPLIANDFILDMAEQESKRIPAVALPRDVEDVEGALQNFIARGARILKIYPMYDGLKVDAESYRRQLEFANKAGMIVILHTGAIHSRLFFHAELGSVGHFTKWFSEYPRITFMLAHMGFHDSNEVISVAKDHANTMLLCSWQPEASIVHAVEQLGGERVLYASDWPLVGDNMEVGLQRIRHAEQEGRLTSQARDLILGENAQRLLRKHKVAGFAKAAKSSTADIQATT